MDFSLRVPVVLMVLMTLSIPPALADSLHQAARQGDLRAVERLVDDGANINAKDPVGTPLHHAVAVGHVEIVELLLARGADVNAMSGIGSPLHVAVLGGRKPVVGILIDAGADVDATVAEGDTPLHYAAQSGNLVLAELLLTHGADINARRERSGTPLHDAVVAGHLALADFLIDKGARPPEIEAVTPLLASASLEEGEAAAVNCRSCHSVERGGKHIEGPNLWNIVGRRKAAMSDFPYSPALAGQSGVWSYEELNGFIAYPQAFVPGTEMEYQTMTDVRDRANIILYLRQLSDDPVALPTD